MVVHAGPYNGNSHQRRRLWLIRMHASGFLASIFWDPDHFSSQTISIGPSRLDHRSSSVTIKVRCSFNFDRSRSLGTGRSVARNGSRHSRGHLELVSGFHPLIMLRQDPSFPNIAVPNASYHHRQANIKMLAIFSVFSCGYASILHSELLIRDQYAVFVSEANRWQALQAHTLHPTITSTIYSLSNRYNTPFLFYRILTIAVLGGPITGMGYKRLPRGPSSSIWPSTHCKAHRDPFDMTVEVLIVVMPSCFLPMTFITIPHPFRIHDRHPYTTSEPVRSHIISPHKGIQQ
jgi:hypothetical protein